MKADFLAVYHYGMGGVWVIMRAQTEQEISAKYPELMVVNERPAWMTDDLYAKIAEKLLFDIEQEPSGWLLELVHERSKR
jgi:hypothetical protein